MTYERLKALIATGRKGSGTKLLQRNTYAEECDNGAIAVRLHRTDILTYYPDGRVRINLGGWNTVTTRQRINAWGPDGVKVYNERGEPHLYFQSGYRWNAIRFAFDGDVTLTRKGTLSTKDQRAAKRLQAERDDRRRTTARNARARRREDNRLHCLGAGIDAVVWWCGGWKLTAAQSIAEALQHVCQSFTIAREVDAMPPPDAFEAWHFVHGDGIANGYTMNGSIPVRVGQTLRVPAGAKQCQYGLHSSPTPSMARQFCSGALLCRVKCWGETDGGVDKSASEYRHIVAMYDVRDLCNFNTFDAECYERFGMMA